MKLKELARSLKHWVNGPHKSYSQTGEDIIADFFMQKSGKGFYVDIGCNDPIHLSNTYFFYKKGWQGLCIEPNSFKAGLVRSIRSRDKVLNIGLGSENGWMDFYIFDPDTISTFSKSEAEEFKKLGHKQLDVKKTQIKTLSDTLAEYAKGMEIDLLSCDTEGMDLKILRSNDWVTFRPKIVITEIAEYRGKTLNRLEAEITTYLKLQNYHKLADTYINGIYISKEFSQLKNYNF